MPKPISHAVAKDEVPANPYEAFRLVVTRYGVKNMADRTGMKAGTLWNKADADVESHHQPTLRDVINVTRESGDTTVLDSLDRLFDRAAFALAPPETCSDEALLDLLLKVGTDHGDLCTAVRHALADQKFTRQDMQKVRSEAFDLVSQVLAFVHRLEGFIDD